MSLPTWTPTPSNPTVFARLSGDYNPVHLDEEHARGAGFETVIIHGMNVLGAAARAAHAAAPGGSALRTVDIRFANPVLPNETLSFEASSKETKAGLKVGLAVTHADGRGVMKPANFIFAPLGEAAELPEAEAWAPANTDVPGDVYLFTTQALTDYDAITRPSEVARDETVPPMMVVLGMTGALEKAFKTMEPPGRKGTWVHLRQKGTFYEQIELDREYTCRIQSGKTKLRESKLGAMVTIPFVIETAGDDRCLVSTGSCGLLYAFDQEDS
jgi:acyl dehydratase